MTLALNLLMPVMLAGISLYAMCKRVDVYDGVIHGAAEGLSVIYRIAPPLIALMTAIAMLRASGALELAAQALSPFSLPWASPPKRWGFCWCGPSAARRPWAWARISSKPTAPIQRSGEWRR